MKTKISLQSSIFLFSIISTMFINPSSYANTINVFEWATIYDAHFKTNIQNKTDVESYYAALSSPDTNQINVVLQRLLPVTSLVNKAYAGALIMKKAGLVKAPGKKLSLFKQGRLLLEEAITKENSDAAYRFLRLVIQENCPAFLKYHDNIIEDSEVVKKTYMQFPAEAKQAVLDYAKTSITLKSLNEK